MRAEVSEDNKHAGKKRNPPRLGGGKRKNRDSRKELRRERAADRQAQRAARTNEQQVTVLDAHEHRAVKERKRLGVHGGR